jgi:hypothetical protein
MRNYQVILIFNTKCDLGLKYRFYIEPSLGVHITWFYLPRVYTRGYSD